MAEPQQSPGLLANILAVAGFFILIVIIVWGAYHLLRLTGSGISSLFTRFNGSGSAITLNAPTSPIPSGKAFTLSWRHNSAPAGSYALVYQCKQGFRFDASMNGTTNVIPCGSAYTVGSGTSVSLTPVLAATSTTEVPLSIIFMPSATSTTQTRPQATAVIAVVPGTTTPATGKTKTTTPKGTAAVPKESKPGIADLSVRIVAVGVIDSYGTFVQRQPMHAGEIAAVKFDIANYGTASSGSWYFTVQLPVQGSYSYASPIQMNLSPGSHIENILRFGPVNPGGGSISVYVDSTNRVPESNESNNAASTYLNAGSWQYQYGTPYVW